MLYLAAPGPVLWVPSTNMLSFPLGAWRRHEQHRHYQVSFSLPLSISISLSFSLSAHIFQRSINTPPLSPCLLPLSSFPPTLPLCLSTLAVSLAHSLCLPSWLCCCCCWSGVVVLEVAAVVLEWCACGGVSLSFKVELGKPIQIAYRGGFSPFPRRGSGARIVISRSPGWSSAWAEGTALSFASLIWITKLAWLCLCEYVCIMCSSGCDVAALTVSVRALCVFMQCC